MHAASRRRTAVAFFLIAASLEATRYLAAAIFGSGVASWNRDLFLAMLQYVGPELRTFAIVALALGGIFLVWAELEALTARRDENDTA